MERDDNKTELAVIELGAASVETQGPDPIKGDLVFGGQLAGLSDD